jgi:hypothetical protein
MNLTTATPAEIDARLAALYYAEGALQGKVDAAMAAIHRGLGERLTVTGRGAARVESWPTSDADAIAAMFEKGDELIGMMRPASAILAKHTEAAAALEANQAEQSPMHAEYRRRGGWTRFFEVAGGHIHREQNCPTLHRGKQRTRLGWLIDMSGTDETQAIAELAAGAHILCSVCIPGAPVGAAPAPRKTAAERAAEREAAERKARTEDPKLIADIDGEPLRVDGTVVRTVRSAEIAAVDALWWAAYGRHTGEPNEAYAQQHEGHAARIVAALAHKNGTTPAAELARLTAKAIKKVRRDLGAEVAAAAAAVWAAQAAAAETAPAPEAPVEWNGRTYGELTKDEQRQVRAEAAGRLQHELERNAPALAALLADEPPAPMTVQLEQQHAQQDDAPAERPAEGEQSEAVPHEVRLQLAGIGQITRELTDAQIEELCDRLGQVTPAPRLSGVSSVPFLAARLILRADECHCVPGGLLNPNCEAHPGYASPTAALAAIAAALKAQDDAEWDEADAAVDSFLDLDDEGDEARDCVRVSTRTDADGQRWQWCGYYRTHEKIEPDDAELAAASGDDAGVGEVQVIAAANAALDRVGALLGDLSIDDLETVACRASELRQQAWEVRAVKQAREIQRERQL